MTPLDWLIVGLLAIALLFLIALRSDQRTDARAQARRRALRAAQKVIDNSSRDVRTSTDAAQGKGPWSAASDAASGSSAAGASVPSRGLRIVRGAR